MKKSGRSSLRSMAFNRLHRTTSKAPEDGVAVPEEVWSGLGGAIDYKGVKSGFLEKQGGRVKSWKRRFMVLLGDGQPESNPIAILHYFKTPSDAEPLGSIVVSGKEVTVCNTKEYGRGFTFSISNPHKKDERVFVLSASSTEERTAWVKALLTTQAMCDHPPSCDSPSGSPRTPGGSLAAVDNAAMTADAMAKKLQMAITFATFDEGFNWSEEKLEEMSLDQLYDLLEEVNEREKKEYDQVVVRTKEYKEQLVDVLHDKLQELFTGAGGPLGVPADAVTAASAAVTGVGAGAGAAGASGAAGMAEKTLDLRPATGAGAPADSPKLSKRNISDPKLIS